jgi:lipopolysaccharide heptosyltransferase I
MKVLVVKLSSIGDIVHCLPAVAAIRQAHPNSKITWIAERRSSEILVDSPAIDRLIQIDSRFKGGLKSYTATLRGLFSNLKELRANSFDIAIDFQGLMKSAVIARASGAKEIWGFGKESLREKESRVFLDRTVEAENRHHVIVKNLILAENALGFMSSRDDLKFPISNSVEDKSFADSIAMEMDGAFVILNPGGGWVTKLWPPEMFGTLSDLLLERAGLKSVITTGPGEEELARRIRESARNKSLKFISPSLKQFHALARKAAAYVGGDTGPTHIAVATGARVIGIFGPTEWWRNGSVNAFDICVERNDISCRENCHRRTCDKWICLDIRPDVVADAVINRIASER